MKASRLRNAIAAVTILAVGGCSATRSTALRISGTPGEQFTARYKSTQGLAGDVTANVAKDGRSSTVLKLPDQELNFEVKKKNPKARLTAEIVQAGKAVFRAEAPAGTQGVRILRTPDGWRQESY